MPLTLPATLRTPPSWLVFPHHQRAIRISLGLFTLGSMLLLALVDLHGTNVFGNSFSYPDAIDYTSVARNLAAHANLNTYNGQPLVEFPPGLPIMLGALLKVGLSLKVAVALINALALGVTIAAVFALFYIVFATPWLALAVSATLAWNTNEIHLYLAPLSEPVFIAAVSVLLAVLAASIKSQRFTRSATAVAVVCVWVACSWRYTGVTLLPVLGFGYYWATKSEGRRAVLRAGVVTLTGALAIIVIAVRNLAVGSGPFGPTLHSSTSLSSSLLQTSRLLGGLVTSGPFSFPLAKSGMGTNPYLGVIGVCFVVLMVLGVLRAIRNKNGLVLCAALFVAGYWSMIIYAQVTNTAFDMNYRLIAETVPAMALLSFYAIMPPAIWQGQHRLRLIGLLVVPLLLANAASSTYLTATNYNFPTVPAVTPMERALSHLPANAGVATPYPQLLYWMTGREPILNIPLAQFYCPPGCSRAQMKVLVHDISDGTVTYALFSTNQTPIEEAILKAQHVTFTTDVITKGYSLYRVQIQSK
jgi:hypothetical protein